jgi:hypothetical protein
VNDLQIDRDTIGGIDCEEHLAATFLAFWCTSKIVRLTESRVKHFFGSVAEREFIAA